MQSQLGNFMGGGILHGTWEQVWETFESPVVPAAIPVEITDWNCK